MSRITYANRYFNKLLSVILLLSFFTCFLHELQAHKVTAVSVVSRFDTKGEKYRIELAMDIYPSEDASANDKISPQQAADFFSNEALMLFFDDKQVESESKSELIKDPDADPKIEEQKVKVIVTLFGDIPKGAAHFSLRVAPETTAAVVMVTFKDGKAGRRAEVLYPGEFSSPVSMATLAKADAPGFVPAPRSAAAPAAVSEAIPPVAKPESKAKGSKGGFGKSVIGNLLKTKSGRADDSESSSDGMGRRLPSMSSSRSAPEHKDVDRGLDSMRYFMEIGALTFFFGHVEALLLVLVIFFFSQKSLFLIRQLIMFTAAYSMALALAVFGMESLTGMLEVIKPILAWGIPLGIVYLAIENLSDREELGRLRQTVIAITGFLMGTVFSFTLGVSGLSSASVGVAFAGFYLGLGLAQATIVVVITLVMMIFWRRSWYRKVFVVPISLLIAGVGLFWIVQQAFL